MKPNYSSIKQVSMMLIVALTTALCSCRTTMPISKQGGQADVGYLMFTSEKEYINKPIDVKVNDGEATFTAKAIKPSKSKSNGTSYQLSTGKKHLVVTKDGETLFQGVVMLYPRETKIITLK